MKPARREFNDHGAFDAKPSDRRWRFWLRLAPGTIGPIYADVTTSGSTWMIARERAVLEYARAGILLAAQDLESMAAPTTSALWQDLRPAAHLNGAAK